VQSILRVFPVARHERGALNPYFFFFSSVTSWSYFRSLTLAVGPSPPPPVAVDRQQVSPIQYAIAPHSPPHHRPDYIGIDSTPIIGPLFDFTLCLSTPLLGTLLPVSRFDAKIVSPVRIGRPFTSPVSSYRKVVLPCP